VLLFPFLEEEKFVFVSLISILYPLSESRSKSFCCGISAQINLGVWFRESCIQASLHHHEMSCFLSKLFEDKSLDFTSKHLDFVDFIF
jgi:hypothetical protein